MKRRTKVIAAAAKRSAAARKGAETRKRNAEHAKRSAAAKKGWQARRAAQTEAARRKQARSEAARKGWEHRKRSAAARKGWETRRGKGAGGVVRVSDVSSQGEFNSAVRGGRLLIDQVEAWDEYYDEGFWDVEDVDYEGTAEYSE